MILKIWVKNEAVRRLLNPGFAEDWVAGLKWI
jgi:hypothetical protein